jgi:hypothetical protein
MLVIPPDQQGEPTKRLCPVGKIRGCSISLQRSPKPLVVVLSLDRALGAAARVEKAIGKIFWPADF